MHLAERRAQRIATRYLRDAAPNACRSCTRCSGRRRPVSLRTCGGRKPVQEVHPRLPSIARAMTISFAPTFSVTIACLAAFRKKRLLGLMCDRRVRSVRRPCTETPHVRSLTMAARLVGSTRCKRGVFVGGRGAAHPSLQLVEVLASAIVAPRLCPKSEHLIVEGRRVPGINVTIAPFSQISLVISSEAATHQRLKQAWEAHSNRYTQALLRRWSSPLPAMLCLVHIVVSPRHSLNVVANSMGSSIPRTTTHGRIFGRSHDGASGGALALKSRGVRLGRQTKIWVPEFGGAWRYHGCASRHTSKPRSVARPGTLRRAALHPQQAGKCAGSGHVSLRWHTTVSVARAALLGSRPRPDSAGPAF